MARRRIDINNLLKPLLALPETTTPRPTTPEPPQEIAQENKEPPADTESTSTLTPKTTNTLKRKNNSKPTKPSKKKKAEPLTIDNFI